MAQFEHEGVLYEELPDGKVRVLGPASNAGPQPFQVSGPDPYKARAEDRADASAERDARLDELRAQILAAEAQIKAQAAAEGATGGNQGTKINPAQAKRAALEALTKQLMEVERQFQANFVGENDRGIAEYLPTPTNKAFDAAAAGLGEQALGAFRTPGVGSQSDAELRAFVAANQPGASQYDEVNQQRIDNIRTRLDEQRKAMGLPQIDWQRREEEGVGPAIKAPGMDRTQLPGGGSGPTGGAPTGPLSLSPDGSSRFATPQDKAFTAQAQSLFDQGASRQQLDALARQFNRPAFGADLDAAISFRDRGGKGARIAQPESGFTPPSTLGKVAASPLGAYGIAAADALTLGRIDKTAGVDRNLVNAAMDESPIASTLGTLTGGALAAGGLELGAARLGAGRLAAVAGDAAYGLGVGSANGNGIEGALAGAGGGILGRGAMRGAGNLATGVRNADVGYLRSAGVPTTVGQTVGQSGRVGAMVKGVEDRIAGLPFVGDLVNARRGEGLEAFNLAALREAGQPIAAQGVSSIGEEGVEQLDDAVRAAYSSALAGKAAQIDPQFGTDLGSAIASTQAIPRVGDELTATLGKTIPPLFDSAGTLTGENFQAALRGVRDLKGAYKTDPLYGSQIGPALGDVEGALTGLFGRQAPEVMPSLNAANEAYKNRRVVGKAVEAATNTGGMFTPAQLGLAARQSARKFGNNADTTNRPFFELQRAGQNLLPNKVPDSGTAGRLAVALPVGAAAAGGGIGYLGGDPAAGAGAGATLGLLYTKGGQKLLVDALTKRPDKAVKAGRALKKRARIGGLFGAPLLTTVVAD